MKVFSTSPLFTVFDPVRSTDASGDALKREKRKNESDAKDPNEPDSEKEYASEAELQAAVGEFTQEAGAAAPELQTQVSGQGPGLRVVLRDGRGAIVRQFTGEEFLRLREAAAGGRGNLLDKKL